MSRASAGDIDMGRLSSMRPNELRLLPFGAALAGETVILYQATYAPRPITRCAACRGVDPVACGMCDGRGEYPDPSTPAVEISRSEITRYTVPQEACWHAPDLCGGPSYYAVIVDDAERARSRVQLVFCVLGDLSPNRGTVVATLPGVGDDRPPPVRPDQDVIHRPASEAPAIGERVSRESWTGPRRL